MKACIKCLRIGLLALFASAPAAASAQTYPNGPVRIITQIAAGNGADVALRIVASHLSEMWGHQAVVVNQPGAGGLIAARAAAAAQPDGHTLFMAVTSTLVALPETQANLPFKVDDFVPIGFVGEVPMVIAASPTLPVNSLPELIALSKKHPEGLGVATPPRGDLPHLAVELLRSRTGANLIAIHYQAMSQAINDVISGRVPIAMEGLGGPSARGQLKLVAVASRARLASRPNVPTVAETVPGFVATGWWALVAPPGTPSAIVRRLSDDLAKVLARADVNQKFQQLGSVTRPMSPQELSDFIRNERALWKPVIRQAGLAAR
jgi:tripartite-type tricarboxylate transporter receptor subunit TctC